MTINYEVKISLKYSSFLQLVSFRASLYLNMKRVFETFVVFLSILASIVSEHGTHNSEMCSCDSLSEMLHNRSPALYFKDECEEGMLPSGKEVRLKCRKNYVRFGNTTAKCKEGNWQVVHGATCIELKCKGPTIPKNGFLRGNLNMTLFSEIEYGCDVTYKLVGERKVKCIFRNGQLEWSSLPYCVVKRCGQPDPIVNGYYKGDDFSIDQLITYYCNRGFSLVGTATRTCGADEQWSGNPPKCEKMCSCDSLSEKLRNRSPAPYFKDECEEGMLPSGEEVQLECIKNFWPSEKPMTAKCKEGNWQVEREATCYAKTCDSLVNPEHGYIQLINNNSVNIVATFTCLPGYTLVGEENTTCMWSENKLQWSNPTPQCIKGEKCKELLFNSYNIIYDPEPEEDFWTEMEYPNGTRATVTCEDGFEIFPLRPIVTNATTTVCVNGQWKPDIVSCTPARCSCTNLPQEMIERKRKLKYCDHFVPSGTHNQWTECEEGYKARGNYGARCAWGVWYIHTPETQYNRCIRRNKSVKDCHLDLKGKDDLTAHHRDHTYEGQEVDFVHLSIVKFSCKSFYSTLEGAKNVTCIDGQWSKDIPVCKRTSAFDLLHPPFLSVYFDNFNRINTDDGRVIIPKETLFRIVCLSSEKRQLTLHERIISGKQWLKVNFSSEDMFSSVKVINPVEEMTEATVECINSNNIATEFNVVIADTCEVDENELNRRGLQVVPDSRQRIYVEGDRIQVECSSNKRRIDQFIMICKSGREWEYAKNMVC